MRIPLLVLLAATLFAQSQPPPPGPRKATQNNKAQATGEQTVAPKNQNNADHTSAAIDKLTSEIASWKKQQAATKDENDSSSGGWLMWSTIATAFATLAIAGLGCFQWRAMHKQRIAMEQQAQYMRDGLALTEISANAAKLAADTAKRALEVTERADILVQAVPISTYPAFNGESVISIVLKNCGRTRGNRVVVDMGLVFVPEIEQIPAEQPIVEAVLGAGDTMPVAFQPPRRCWTKETVGRIIDGGLTLRFEAEVVYFDVFDKRHRTKCSGAFDPGTCSFRIDANQEAD
jgi:hypothetical protein